MDKDNFKEKIERWIKELSSFRGSKIKQVYPSSLIELVDMNINFIKELKKDLNLTEEQKEKLNLMSGNLDA